MVQLDQCVSLLCTLACTWLLLQICTQMTLHLRSLPNHLPKVATAPPVPRQTTLFYGTFDLLLCPRAHSLVVAVVLLLLGSQ